MKGPRYSSRLREVNLELGMPFADQAIKRLTFEIHHRAMGCTVLKIIHGYGSSGKGGKIRTESRKYLTRLKRQGEIRDFVKGEQFSIFEEATRQAFARCEELRRDHDLDRYNNGVTEKVRAPWIFRQWSMIPTKKIPSCCTMEFS